MEFQSDQPGNAGFLSDAIGTSGTANLPPFTECVVLATICGRSINHRHQTMVERLYGHAPHDFWDRQQWLDSILTQQIQILSLQYCFPSQQVDPMVLFTTMLSNAALLYLFKIIEPTSSEPKDQQVSFMEYEKRSLSAAQKIAHLAKALSQLSCFKVISFTQCTSTRAKSWQAHPFTPISLILCAEFFMTYKGLEENFSLELSDISDALRELKNVNNLAKDYLHLIEKTCLNSRGETLT